MEETTKKDGNTTKPVIGGFLCVLCLLITWTCCLAFFDGNARHQPGVVGAGQHEAAADLYWVIMKQYRKTVGGGQRV